jgi:hypothetical protein
MDLLNWLAELARQASPPERRLIDQVQQALFSSNPAAMPADLDEPQLTVWNQILQRLQETE